MAHKKSFKDANPALQFINTVTETSIVKELEPAKTTRRVQNKSKLGSEDEASASTKTTEFMQERKSKRLNLLLVPSVMKDLVKIAHMRRTSVNDLINTVLKDYAETESSAVKRYDDFFKIGEVDNE